MNMKAPWRVSPIALSASFDQAVTGRSYSLFHDDMESIERRLASDIRGARILVVGAAGSIGSATAKFISRFEPTSLHAIDNNENSLADLARDFQASGIAKRIRDLRFLPLDYSSPIGMRFLQSEAYDAVLNFAAIKHVRSEKDVFCILQMLETNVVRPARFGCWLAQMVPAPSYFAVSTDKAVKPTSLMGATKRLMEDVTFFVTGSRSTCARFPNVAFSNGSVLRNLLIRVSSHEAIGVPREVHRYFISHEDAAILCAVSAFLIPKGMVAIPLLDPAFDLRSILSVTREVLSLLGLEMVEVRTADEARNSIHKLAAEHRYPVLVTDTLTSGEKAFEEFIGQGEELVQIGYKSIHAIKYSRSTEHLSGLLDTLTSIINNPAALVSKHLLIDLIGEAVPELKHVETGRSLDTIL